MIGWSGGARTVRSKLAYFWILTAIIPLFATAKPAPQTARQALIEMFFSKTAGTFRKHLPEAMLAALSKANGDSASSPLNGFALLLSRLPAGDTEVQTFEAGPVLFSFENPRENSKFEILVERDDLQADEDEIEVSFRGSKNGQSQLSGVSPRFTFGMKPEDGIWRVEEITLTFKVSLTNPELLKAVSTPWKPTVETPNPSANISYPVLASASNETSAISAMRTILGAETTYAATYGHGYTCSLSDLGGMGANERNEHQAMLIEPRLANGKKNGYRFALTGCSGGSAPHFSLVAVPAETAGGIRSFCADESGVMRSSSNGSAASCLSAGTPLP
jgi:hypothetical protein